MDIIVLGGLIFWILTAIFLIVFFASMHKEKGIIATISLFSYFFLLAVFGSFDMTGFIIRNPIMLAIFTVSYFLCGTIWAFFRWNIFAGDILNKYNDHKKEWLEKKGINGHVVPDDMKKEWTQAVKSYATKIKQQHFSDGKSAIDAIKPRVRENKGRIMLWLSYWPFSFCHYLFADVLSDIWNWIYRMIGNSLQSISDRKFRGIDSELE